MKKVQNDVGGSGLSISAKDLKIANECIICTDIIVDDDDEMSLKFEEASRRMYEETLEYERQHKT